jgi:putative ATP-dependent endonuclease of the OLD family
MATAAPATTLAEEVPSGIAIVRVRIRNYRCLRAVTVPLQNTTVLIGENNVGKTSFIDAIHAAIGSGVKSLSEDDIFISHDETMPPKDRDVTIDLLIRPVDAGGTVLNEFPDGSPWTELWGNGIAQDDRGHDQIIIRTKLSWTISKGEYVAERHFLREWSATEDEAAAAPKMTAPLASQHIEPLALFALDAKRDVVDDLRSRSSLWAKLVSDPGLPKEAIEEIEAALSALNEKIVQNSAVLSHVETHLHTVAHILQCDDEGISITPVARHLRDLNRGMDVRLSMKGASSFPLAKQGMGTRSLATMLLFRAYMTWKQKTLRGDALHPFVSIEEPEVHLHPHAQRALFQQIRQIPGQKLVSTHSPYVSSQAGITEFLHLMKEGSETRVTWCNVIDPTTGDELLTREDLRRIDREVMNTRGDILFCRCLVLFEGETEEQAVPGFAASRWGHHPNELGISFVGVGGSGKYLAFLRLANGLRIPWVVLCDGEPDAISALDAALAKLHEPAAASNPRVVILPNGQCFEAYVATADPAYLDVLKAMIVDNRAQNARHRVALEREWATRGATEVIAELQGSKTLYGARLPGAFVTLADERLRVPEMICKALDLVFVPEPTTERVG